MKYFRELGERIEEKWRGAHFNHTAFPRICREALDFRPAHQRVSAAEVIRWGLSSRHLPLQHDPEAMFGEPPVTVYRGQDFFIDVNFWLTSTTAIHEHSFSGAFQVLEGSSLETTFRFERARTISAYMAVGRLEEVDSCVLTRGTTREIRASSTIHSLFHLQHPSATVVVRTGRDPGAAPQLSYFRPGVALDPRYDPADLRRRTQFLSLVAKSAPRRLASTCLRFLRSADIVSRFVALRHCVTLLSPTEGDTLLKRARRIDPTIAALVREVVEGDRREAFLIRRRGPVTDPELRFFLAVLLNVRGRTEAMALVAKRFPRRDPIAVVMQWVRALGASPAPDDASASALGFPADDVVLAVLEGALRGQTRYQIARGVGRVVGRTVSPREQIDLGQLRRALERSEIFRYLLRVEPA